MEAMQSPAVVVVPQWQGSVRPEIVAAALRATGRQALHVHLDLDVLDPAVFPDTTYQEPGGATVSQVREVLRAAAGAMPVTSAFIGEHLGGDTESTRIAEPLMRDLLAIVGAKGPA
jgi:arginase